MPAEAVPALMKLTGEARNTVAAPSRAAMHHSAPYVADEDETLLAQVREMILSGEFAPGAAVPQVPLARALGVSTTPLREAMRQLQSEGLLEVQRNHRARVPPLDIGDLHAVYAARVLLESHGVATTAASAGPALRARLQRQLEAMHDTAEAHDIAAWTTIHRAFHLDLLSGATPSLLRTIRNFIDRSERYRRLAFVSISPARWSPPHEEHRLIVDSFASRDGPGAAAALATHLARTAIQLSAAFAPEIEPVAVRVAVALIVGARPGTSAGPAAATPVTGHTSPSR